MHKLKKTYFTLDITVFCRIDKLTSLDDSNFTNCKDTDSLDHKVSCKDIWNINSVVTASTGDI